jgi:two-component system LytT family response regulator
VSALVRAVIVDDEPLARERIRNMLATRPEYTVVAECGDGEEAIAVIVAERPDLVFLDVQMPELDGFAVLEALTDAPIPAIIFVTAHEEHAIRAFEVSAVDYLLKPFDRERFAKALARATTHLGRRRETTEWEPELRTLLERLRAERGYATRFVVRNEGKLTFVRANDVDWIEGAGNYVRLHVAGRALLLRETMKSVESRLDPAAIVNIDRVASLEPYFHGEYVVTMRDGSKLTSSRSQSARLRALLR